MGGELGGARIGVGVSWLLLSLDCSELSMMDMADTFEPMTAESGLLLVPYRSVAVVCMMAYGR